MFSTLMVRVQTIALENAYGPAPGAGPIAVPGRSVAPG
jgi:hypothetical protein